MRPMVVFVVGMMLWPMSAGAVTDECDFALSSAKRALDRFQEQHDRATDCLAGDFSIQDCTEMLHEAHRHYAELIAAVKEIDFYCRND